MVSAQGRSALGQPGEERAQRTLVIAERGGREAALVMQRAHQILEGVIADTAGRAAAGDPSSGCARPVPSGSVLVMKHGRTSLNVGRSAVSPTVMCAGSVTLTP